MSFYIDPWLYNCATNPADTPAEQAEQRPVIAATQRAIDYARAHGVTTIAAEGNGNTDLGKPTSDDTSPDYPDAETSPHARTIDNSCLSMPTEANGVIGVTSVGPSQAQGLLLRLRPRAGRRVGPGRRPPRLLRDDALQPARDPILAAYPESVGRAAGTIDADGNPTTLAVVKDDDGYYQ